MMTITKARVTRIAGSLHLHLTANGCPMTLEIDSREVALLLAAEVSSAAAKMPGAPPPAEPQHHHIEGEWPKREGQS
jgi:hypothetical protein